MGEGVIGQILDTTELTAGPSISAIKHFFFRECFYFAKLTL